MKTNIEFPSLKKKQKSKSKSKSKQKEALLEKIYLSPPVLKKDPTKKPTSDKKDGKEKEPLIIIKKIQSSPAENKKKVGKSSEDFNKRYNSVYERSRSRSKTNSKSKQKDKVSRTNDQQSIKAAVEDCKEKIKKGQILEAQKRLKKLLSVSTNPVEVLFLLGSISLMKNSKKQSKHYFCEYIKRMKKGCKKKFSEDEFASVIKASYFLQQYEEALKYCSRLLEISQSAFVYGFKGRILLILKKYGPAMDSFFKALRFDKSSPELYEGLGDCYRETEAFEMALQQYNEVEKILKQQVTRIVKKKLNCYQKLKDKKKETEYKEILSRLRRGSSRNTLCTLDDQVASNNIDDYFYGVIHNLSKLENKQENNVETLLMIGNVEEGLRMINEELQRKKTFKNYNLRAQLYFMQAQYEKCQKDINNALQSYEKQIVVNHLQSDKKKYKNIKYMITRLKEINAYSLSQSQDTRIVKRRKKCLEEALNTLRNEGNENQNVLRSKLSQIPEQSSLMNSSIYLNTENTIFRLKNIREILKNWGQNQFSISSIQKTTDIAFKMVKKNNKDFSCLPLHIIYAFLKPQNLKKNFKEVNNQISSILEKMCKKYPPSEKVISQSNIRRFNIEWKNQEKINLFRPDAKFNSFKELHKAIEKLANLAQSERIFMDKIANQVCKSNHGFNFKSCLKIEKDYLEDIEQRVLCRVVQKILSKDIKKWKDQFFKGIELKEGQNIQFYFDVVNKEWEETIDFILQKKIEANEPVCFYVYDLVRAKCMFHNVQDIVKTCQGFIKLHEKKEIFLLQIDNRLSYKTKDVVIKFKVKNIVGELQLALEFESLQNQFNHGLYQLYRSQFGPFFASIMWFSGFGLKKNRLFFKEKLKWNLRGLDNLKKFIYEDNLFLQFPDFPLIKCIEIKDFDVSLFEMTCTVCNSNFKTEEFRLIIKAVDGTFIDDEIIVTLRVQNTMDFVKARQDKMTIIELQDSNLAQQDYRIKVNFLSLRQINDYDEEIRQTKKSQKKVIELMKIQ